MFLYLGLPHKNVGMLLGFTLDTSLHRIKTVEFTHPASLPSPHHNYKKKKLATSS